MKGCGSFILIATFLFYIAGYISVLRTPVMVWHTAYWSKRLKIVTPFLFAQSSVLNQKLLLNQIGPPKNLNQIVRFTPLQSTMTKLIWSELLVGWKIWHAFELLQKQLLFKALVAFFSGLMIRPIAISPHYTVWLQRLCN